MYIFLIWNVSCVLGRLCFKGVTCISKSVLLASCSQKIISNQWRPNSLFSFAFFPSLSPLCLLLDSLYIIQLKRSQSWGEKFIQLVYTTVESIETLTKDANTSLCFKKHCWDFFSSTLFKSSEFKNCWIPFQSQQDCINYMDIYELLASALHLPVEWRSHLFSNDLIQQCYMKPDTLQGCAEGGGLVI